MPSDFARHPGRGEAAIRDPATLKIKTAKTLGKLAASLRLASSGHRLRRCSLRHPAFAVESASKRRGQPGM